MRLSAMLAVAGLLATPQAVLAQPAPTTAAFEAACNAKPELLEQSQGDTARLERFCSCLVDGLLAGDLSQSDIDMLTADLDETATDAERMAYETYEDLTSFASEAVNQCLLREGVAQGGRG